MVVTGTLKCLRFYGKIISLDFVGQRQQLLTSKLWNYGEVIIWKTFYMNNWPHSGFWTLWPFFTTWKAYAFSWNENGNTKLGKVRFPQTSSSILHENEFQTWWVPFFSSSNNNRSTHHKQKLSVICRKGYKSLNFEVHVDVDILQRELATFSATATTAVSSREEFYLDIFCSISNNFRGWIAQDVIKHLCSLQEMSRIVWRTREFCFSTVFYTMHCICKSCVFWRYL